MANVIVKGASSSKHQHVISLVANHSCCTQISQRLAKKLGLIHFDDVYITERVYNSGSIMKWKRSVFPMIIFVPELNNKSISCYPIINCCEKDAYWEMIIGLDVLINKNGIDFLSMSLSTVHFDIKPTPGPSYDEDVHYLGHNIVYASLSKILERDVSEYLEYLCFDSNAISRLAVNHKKRLIVVQYSTSDEIYKYEKVPQDLIKKILDGESKGETLNLIKNTCNLKKPNSFPDTVMIFEK